VAAKKDISMRKLEKIGPFQVFLPSGRRNADNSFVMVDVEVNGAFEKQPEKETEPFLEEVYFKKNTYSLRAEESFKEQASDAPFMSTLQAMLRVTVSWDCMDGEIPVPLTIEGIRDHDVDIEVISAVLSKYAEVTRVPKEPQNQLPVTSSVEE
jgi:hypothetical protein